MIVVYLEINSRLEHNTHIGRGVETRETLLSDVKKVKIEVPDEGFLLGS